MLRILCLSLAMSASLGCATLSGRTADPYEECDENVTADSIAAEAPAVYSGPDDPEPASLVRVDLPAGWVLENESGDSFVMSNGDGSRAIIRHRQDGCAVHVTFRQDGMDCVVSFDCAFSAEDPHSDEMFAAISPQPDGTAEMRYLLVGWPEATAQALRDAFIPGRRQAVCTR